MLHKQERLQIFLNRLKKAKPAADHDSAFKLLGDTLNEIEDEHTEIPFNPENFITDGRMYPPQRDARRLVEGRTDLIRYRSKAHNTYISQNGAILILGLDNQCFLSKAGANRRKIKL